MSEPRERWSPNTQWIAHEFRDEEFIATTASFSGAVRILGPKDPDPSSEPEIAPWIRFRIPAPQR